MAVFSEVSTSICLEALSTVRKLKGFPFIHEVSSVTRTANTAAGVMSNGQAWVGAARVTDQEIGR